MNVANLELCKELYELSGWDNPGLGQYIVRPFSSEDPGTIPKYDLGYLMRKLPGKVRRSLFSLQHEPDSVLGEWYAGYARVEHADTPEDAVAKLAIELFKQNILPATNPEKQR